MIESGVIHGCEAAQNRVCVGVSGDWGWVGDYDGLDSSGTDSFFPRTRGATHMRVAGEANEASANWQ